MIDFLRTLWMQHGHGLYGELRLIGKASTDQRFYQITEEGLDRAEHTALQLRDAFDVYFGVLPRRRQEGTADAVIGATRVLWADLDAKSFPTKDDALSTLTRMLALPQIIVDSGHGYHAYWLLSHAVFLDQAQTIMKGIEREVGGDHVSDAPRILRIPGTFNHKDDPARPVRLLRFDVRQRYKQADLDDYLVAGLPTIRPRSIRSESHIRSGELPDWLLELIRDGVPKGQRSEAVLKVCLWMLRYGYVEDEIRNVITSYPSGIGAKYFEMGKHGDRWLARTINAAQERA